MTFSPGTKLGRYEIRSQVGAGGMGEVYRARDTELGRDVAVKVLPSSFSADKDRLSRFKLEACAAGALNHPNILVVHDIGAHNGSPYVISELLEGQTLRQRIGGTGIPQRKAIEYAQQMVNGLAAAHEKKFIHRDLKPENIFLTKDERVKILDFGLAKLTQSDADGAQSNLPTRRVDTDPGVVMGTVGYMSPEQLKGGPVDQRSDIFSFGAILYEMLSGERAFHRGSTAETMSAILKEDPPDLSNTNKNISPALERLVHHCLEKNPEARFHSARDLAFALEGLSGSSPTSSQTVAMPALPLRRVTRRDWILGSIAAVAVVAALVSAVVLVSQFRRAPTDVRAVRLFINPPDKTGFGYFAVSPDGLRLVFVATDASGKSGLWVRSLDSIDAQPLSGTDDARYPFWSPDSRTIGFFAAGKLKKIEISGGTVQTVCYALGARGGTWSQNGVIVFGSTNDRLYQVSVAGGESVPVTNLDPSQQEASHRWPYFLPDGSHFLYSVVGGPGSQGIYVASLDRGETRRLLNISSSVAAYAAPGYLLFRRESTLMAQAFDANKLQLSGEPFPIAERVGFDFDSYQTFFSASQTGLLAYSNNTIGKTQLTWIDRGGKEVGLVGQPGSFVRPSLSPDGKRIVVDGADFQGNRDVWVFDLASGNPTRFTFDPAQELFAVWAPDSSRIVFASDRQGPRNLYQRSATGVGKEELLLKTDLNTYAADWHGDSQVLIYNVTDPKTKSDVWILPMMGDQKPFPFMQSAASETRPRLSPNGRWLAYISDETGVNQVYVQSFPASGAQWQVSTNGGNHLEWRRDGKELFYVSTDNKMMAVAVKGEGPTFEVGAPKALFDLRVSSFNHPQAQFAVTADGQKFLIANTYGEISSGPITVVLNWTADLKR